MINIKTYLDKKLESQDQKIDKLKLKFLNCHFDTSKGYSKQNSNIASPNLDKYKS